MTVTVALTFRPAYLRRTFFEMVIRTGTDCAGRGDRACGP